MFSGLIKSFPLPNGTYGGAYLCFYSPSPICKDIWLVNKGSIFGGLILGILPYLFIDFGLVSKF